MCCLSNQVESGDLAKVLCVCVISCGDNWRPFWLQESRCLDCQADRSGQGSGKLGKSIWDLNPKTGFPKQLDPGWPESITAPRSFSRKFFARSMCNLSATSSHQLQQEEHFTFGRRFLYSGRRGALHLLHFRLLLAISGFAASRPQTMSFSSCAWLRFPLQATAGHDEPRLPGV